MNWITYLLGMYRLSISLSSSIIQQVLSEISLLVIELGSFNVPTISFTFTALSPPSDAHNLKVRSNQSSVQLYSNQNAAQFCFILYFYFDFKLYSVCIILMTGYGYSKTSGITAQTSADIYSTQFGQKIYLNYLFYSFKNYLE